MTLILGIHSGHEASCAVVRDGQLVAAIQQERVTRTKYDGQECLSDRLPIPDVLRVADARIEDVDLIVSSFQAVGPAAVGLQRPLIASDFSAFDPFDDRHVVVSHHLAHAASTAYLSGFRSAAVLVSDSAGSTTRDGLDYVLSFADFFRRYATDDATGEETEEGPDRPLFTEMRSVYHFVDDELRLLAREYNRPHNQPDVYVQGEASLYDNVSRFIFRKEHSHGQFMALAGLPFSGVPRLSRSDIIEDGGVPRVRNGWQDIKADPDPAANADIAIAVQDAFTELVVHQAQRAVELAGERRLCCAGGVFLNLTANTAIADGDGVDEVYVPSCPHDAGISIGAAFLGQHRLDVDRRQQEPGVRPPGRAVLRSDFHGPVAAEIPIESARVHGFPVVATDTAGALLDRTIEALLAGAVVARFAGRAEFGPRALGNRSILCHPVKCPDAQDKLNTIKGRQSWRPVAPVVRVEDVGRYFQGPPESPFMNFNFTVRPEYKDALAEGLHADGTARVQTVSTTDNPFLHTLLGAIAAAGELPVLINTSLNGPGEPILESPDDVLLFAKNTMISHVLTATHLFDATARPRWITVRRRPGSVLASFGTGPARRFLISDPGASLPVNGEIFVQLCQHEQTLVDRHTPSIAALLEAGLLSEVQ